MPNNIFLALANPEVRLVNPYQLAKPADMQCKQLGLSGITNLASNENPLGPSTKVINALLPAVHNISCYPDSNGVMLKNKLANMLKVSARQIVLGNGSCEIITLCARAFLRKNTNAVFSEYAFLAYKLAATLAGATCYEVPAKNWGCDLTAILNVIKPQTRIIFIANPNSPTGTLLDYQQCLDFIKAIPNNVIVVFDEAYYEYVSDPSYKSMLGVIDKYPNVMILRSFSKAYGLAGLRIGYSISHPDIADILDRVRDPVNINALALIASAAALDDQEYLARTLQVNKEGLAQLEKGCRELNFNYIKPNGNFITVNMERPAHHIAEKLLSEGLIVSVLTRYNMPNYLRITSGLPEQNEKIIAALSRIMKQL